MSSIPEFNEINALEYETLKTSYELLNKKFRASQRTVDQHSHFMRKELASLDDKLHAKDGPVLLKDVFEDIKKLSARVSQICDDVQNTSSEQRKSSIELLQRVEGLCEAEALIATPLQDMTAEKNIRLELFRRLRLDRFLIEHLLRCGYFETADALARSVGLDMSSVIEVFRAAKEVEETLARGDLSASLAWVFDNRSKLHRLNSSFETEVRIQQCAELIRVGRRMDAVSCARSYFGHLPAKQWRHGNLLVLFGLLGFGVESLPKNNAYERLLGPDRYRDLLVMFRQVHKCIFHLATQSAFSACFHTGAAAHKTPYCKEDPTSRCIVCSRLYRLAEGLPVAHEPHSKIICSISGQPLNECNLPMMLPNGHVYGEQAIRAMSFKSDNSNSIMFRCPFTGETFNVETIKRVYIL